ncbi:hypothetical protein [Undibacterium squillarum]|uniref:hypothetical protein n=1 Tax=Undibacterium squillarum TaxID=1131567 RepID=UPI0035ADAEEA
MSPYIIRQEIICIHIVIHTDDLPDTPLIHLKTMLISLQMQSSDNPLYHRYTAENISREQIFFTKLICRMPRSYARNRLIKTMLRFFIKIHQKHIATLKKAVLT